MTKSHVFVVVMEPYRGLTFFLVNGENSYARVGGDTKNSAPAL